MSDKERAKHDPAAVYKFPSAVLVDEALAHAEKVDILRRWAYDEREKAVAEEENMIRSNNERGNMLDEILRCLLILGIEKDEENPPPTKHG